jgi:hypothetical protein
MLPRFWDSCKRRSPVFRLESTTTWLLPPSAESPLGSFAPLLGCVHESPHSRTELVRYWASFTYLNWLLFHPGFWLAVRAPSQSGSPIQSLSLQAAFNSLTGCLPTFAWYHLAISNLSCQLDSANHDLLIAPSPTSTSLSPVQSLAIPLYHSIRSHDSIQNHLSKPPKLMLSHLDTSCLRFTIISIHMFN